jgi:hypothetical protein
MMNQEAMSCLQERRLVSEAERLGRHLTRAEQAKVARGVWRDGGAVKPDQIRTSFLRTSRKMGQDEAKCPKS